MEISKRTSQQFLIGTGLMLIVPMLIFPSQFGFELAKATWVNLCYELVVYAAILFFVNRRVRLVDLAKAASLCLVYRLTLGAVFGALVSFSYSMDFMVSLQLGTLSYLPSILFQIIVTPIILMPLLRSILASEYELTSDDRATIVSGREKATSSNMPISKEQSEVFLAESQPITTTRREPISKQANLEAGQGLNQDLTGFERAVRYIGEHGSVQLAAVVDHEGLLLARYTRSSFDPEDCAPLARMLFEANQATIIRSSLGLSELDRIDLGMKNEKIVICRQSIYSVMIIAERQSDDLLNIRINQGLDLINKYVNERYSEIVTSNLEKKYVPGTE